MQMKWMFCTLLKHTKSPSDNKHALGFDTDKTYKLFLIFAELSQEQVYAQVTG